MAFILNHEILKNPQKSVEKTKDDIIKVFTV